MARKRVAILISGRGSNMVALIEAAKDQRLSGRDRAGRLQRARPPKGLQRARRGRHRDRRRRSPRRSARIARRSSARCKRVLEAARHRARLPRRLHAAADAVVRRAMGRPAAQHPSGAAAGVQGPRHPRPRARGRRQGARRDRAFRGAGDGFRPDHRAGRGAGAAPATPRQRSPRACSRSSTGSIRRRCGWWRKAASRIVDGRCLIDGRPSPPASQPDKTKPPAEAGGYGITPRQAATVIPP